MAEQPNVVGGAPITSSWGNLIRDRTVMPFTNAASRNADIPTGTAGQFVYLEDIDVLQVYNGAAWVTVTPLAATVAANEVRSGTTFGDLTTVGPAVSIETGTKALVRITTQADSVAGANIAVVGVAVSGATTRAADDTTALWAPLSGGVGWPLRCTAECYFTGLTAGTNTFTMKYRVGTLSTNFSNRTISVVGLA